MVFQRLNGALPITRLPHGPHPAKRRHIGLGPGLVNKDKALGIDAALVFAP